MLAIIDNQMVIIFMHAGTHPADSLAPGKFRRCVMLDDEFFAAAEILQRGDFNRVFFKEVSESGVVDYSASSCINSMMAISKMLND